MQYKIISEIQFLPLLSYCLYLAFVQLVVHFFIRIDYFFMISNARREFIIKLLTSVNMTLLSLAMLINIKTYANYIIYYTSEDSFYSGKFFLHFIPLDFESLYFNIYKPIFSEYLLLSLNSYNLYFLFLFSFLFPIVIWFLWVEYRSLHWSTSILIYFIFFLINFFVLVENILIFFIIYLVILILFFFTINLSSEYRVLYRNLRFYAYSQIIALVLISLGVFILIFNQTTDYFFQIDYTFLVSNSNICTTILVSLGSFWLLSIFPSWYLLVKAQQKITFSMSIFSLAILPNISFYFLIRLSDLLLFILPLKILIIFLLGHIILLLHYFIKEMDLKAKIVYMMTIHQNLVLLLFFTEFFDSLEKVIIATWSISISVCSIFLIIHILEEKYETTDSLKIYGVSKASLRLSKTIVLTLILFLDLPFFFTVWIHLLSCVNTFLGIEFFILLFFVLNCIYFFFNYKIWWRILYKDLDLEIKNYYFVKYMDDDIRDWVIYFLIFGFVLVFIPIFIIFG